MARFPPADCEQQGILVHPGVVGRVGPGPGALFRPPQGAVAGDLNGKGRLPVPIRYAGALQRLDAVHGNDQPAVCQLQPEPVLLLAVH